MGIRWIKTASVIILFTGIIVPIIINYVCLIAFPSPVVGDGKLWLGFWGSYLGGIMALLSTIYVLYKEHKLEYNRKDYEIQKDYLNSLCNDMGKLCSAIDVDLLSFYLMNMTNNDNAIDTIKKIGKLEKEINCEYNEFSLKYAHLRGCEGNHLLNTYSHNANFISHQISIIQEAVVNKQIGRISLSEYNSTIRKVCKELENIGDVRSELLNLAEQWKKQEFYITEEKLNKYKNL